MSTTMTTRVSIAASEIENGAHAFEHHREEWKHNTCRRPTETSGERVNEFGDANAKPTV